MNKSIGADGGAAPQTALRHETLRAASTNSHAPGLDALANSVGIMPKPSDRSMGDVGQTPQALRTMSNAGSMIPSRSRPGHARVDEEVILNRASTHVPSLWPGPTRADTQIDPRYGADWLTPSQPRHAVPHFTPTRMPQEPRDRYITPTRDENTIPTLVPTQTQTAAVGFAPPLIDEQLALQNVEFDESVYANDVNVVCSSHALEHSMQVTNSVADAPSKPTHLHNQAVINYGSVVRVCTPQPQYQTRQDNLSRGTENRSPDMPILPDSPRSFRPISVGQGEQPQTFSRSPLHLISPSRVHSCTSGRPESHASVVDVLGQVVNRFADDHAERERANLDRERKLFDVQLERERREDERRYRFEQYNAEIIHHMMKDKAQMIEHNSIKEREQVRLAHERENRIREDMKQLAQLEARNAVLEQQLRDKTLNSKIAGVTAAVTEQSVVSTTIQTSPKATVPSSPKLDLFGQFLTKPLIPEFLADVPEQSQTNIDKPPTVMTTAPAVNHSHSHQQLSGITHTVSKPTDTIQAFPAPTTPSLKSTTLVPISSIVTPTPEVRKLLSTVNTPSGPAVQLVDVGTPQPIDTQTVTTVDPGPLPSSKATPISTATSTSAVEATTSVSSPYLTVLFGPLGTSVRKSVRTPNRIVAIAPQMRTLPCWDALQK